MKDVGGGIYQVDLVSSAFDDEDGVAFSAAFHTGPNNVTPITVTAAGTPFWEDLDLDEIVDPNENIVGFLDAW